MELNEDREEEKENNIKNNDISLYNIKKPRTKFSKKGGKPPYSLYTRRVIDTSKIMNYLSESSSHGLCGSYNLGNTCFMNSSIACLSNCIELTCYFLSGEYKKEINKNNKHGMGGALAESWAVLLRDYWIGMNQVGDPSDFKETFGHKIKRFSGFSQQDSNEFIDLFLDILNEDLNYVCNKEYIELKEKKDNETDEQCSKRFWDNYLKRNDSIVTDLFCGQIKSTINCPECGFINITFDPFNTLNLNIPKTQTNKYYSYLDYIGNFNIFYIPKYYLRKPIKIKCSNIPKKAKFKDWVRCLKNDKKFIYYGKLDKMFLTTVTNKDKILKEYINEDDAKSFEDFNKNEFKYFAFDIINEKENKYIPVYYKDQSGFSAFPRIIMLSEEDTMDDLRRKIYFNLRKLIYSPLKDNFEDKNELDEKIKEYNENSEIEDNLIFELINDEYKNVFIKENDNYKKNINNFIKDMPFHLYLQKSILFDIEKIDIINKKNFSLLPKEFIEISNIASFNDSIKNLYNLLEEQSYYIILEFNTESHYINKNFYKLNSCTSYDLIYTSEEEEKQNSEYDNDEITLKKCLELFSKEEKLKPGDEWYCPQCKNQVLPNKKMELYYTPKILIICFKRFTKGYYYWQRNDENILFPINDFNMKEFITGPDKNHSVYDLFAVSQHYGGTGFGHYTAICKNFDKWYSYDDSSVYEVYPEKAITSDAYVLFYRRKTD